MCLSLLNGGGGGERIQLKFCANCSMNWWRHYTWSIIPGCTTYISLVRLNLAMFTWDNYKDHKEPFNQLVWLKCNIVGKLNNFYFNTGPSNCSLICLYHLIYLHVTGYSAVVTIPVDATKFVITQRSYNGYPSDDNFLGKFVLFDRVYFSFL